MASYPPPSSAQPQAGGLPYVSAIQAAALLRSAAAIATELAGSAFGPISKAVFDELATRLEAPGVPGEVKGWARQRTA